MKLRHALLSVFAGIVLLAGCSSLDEKQREWIFQPSDRSWGAAMTDGMQDVWIEFDSKVSGEPTKLHALWMAGPPEAGANGPVLLYLHGARWNVSGSAGRIRRMQELGFSVLAIDYRGFGKSTNVLPSEDSAYEDAKQAWDWLARKHPTQPRYIFGHSLGGAIGIDLATRVKDESGLIVEGTFTSIPEVVATFKWGWLPVSGLITQRFESLRKIDKIGSPLLVVHGSNDSLILPSLGRKLYEAAIDPKRFVLVEGGSHHSTNSVGQDQYREALRDLFGWQPAFGGLKTASEAGARL
ncbi:alpha/beta hydrolase [Variovorax sp. VNK109]|uniref:alpha/beta hydrolase n=1 Tax=Variovorax sp. VNK109 TaxID=3400919 RepID=UPI003C08F412